MAFTRLQDGVTDRKILLVGEDQEDGVPELVLVQHALQLLPGLDDTIAVVGVNDEDDALGVLEVMPPERPDLVLATDIPHGELDVLVLDRLDIEALARMGRLGTEGATRHNWCRMGWARVHTNGRDRGDDFAQLQLVQDGRLSGGVKPHHQDSHLLLSP